MLDTSVRAVPNTAYTIVLRHHVAKPGVCQTVTRLCHTNGFGHSWRVRDCWSLINASSAMNTNGSTNSKAALIAHTWRATHSSVTLRLPLVVRRVASTPGSTWDSVVIRGCPGRRCP